MKKLGLLGKNISYS
ncbi:hypothetical protein, partial [Flavobacterium psychrophilum]